MGNDTWFGTTYEEMDRYYDHCSKKLEKHREKVERNKGIHREAVPSIRKVNHRSESDATELPDQVQHFFHHCPLFHKRDVRAFSCDACYESFYDTSCYRCERCDFDMHVQCALDPPVNPRSESGDRVVQHFSHWHLLTAFSNEEMEGDYALIFCKICGQLCSLGDGATNPHTSYTCKECRFYIHKSCMENLPQKIEHIFHDCCLILLTKPRIRCEACDGEGSGLCYFCGECGFCMCLECSLLSTSDNKKKIQHALHGHTLTLVENLQVINEALCEACGRHSSEPTYTCNRCNYFLHKSCAHLPHEITSPFHPAHPLFLQDMAYNPDADDSRCLLCLKKCVKYFAFCCDECNILLDVECAFLTPTIDYGRHNHLLTIVQSLHVDEFKCFACDKKHTDFPAFRCVECNFSLHLFCGPLPLYVKHKYHVHSLTLLDYFVEDDRYDHCCLVCEMPRDPELCVYRCAECLFVAEVQCVIPEILLSLRGRFGEVKLRTIGKHIPSKLVICPEIALKDIKKNRTCGDRKDGSPIIRHTPCSRNIVKYFNIQEVSECNIISYMNGDVECNLKFRGKPAVRIKEATFSYSDECFKQLMKRLKLNSLLWDYQLQNFVEEHKKFVRFEKMYLFPETLIPTFQKLFDKHGDLSINSKAKGPNTKSVYFYLLCCALESMSTTKVIDVTEDHLSNWHACLHKVRNAGFNVEFIYDHLDHVVRAHFGLRAQKFSDDTTGQLERKIERLSEELEDSKRQLANHKKFMKNGTTSLMKQCLNDARKMKYVYAAGSLL